jgi:hypothetical protein
VKQFSPRSNTDTITARLPDAQWQDYADNASRFATEWAHETDEKGEAHSFWDEFLQIFQIRRRQFARHEARAKRSDNRRGFIDLFWPGKLLVEHKAGHKNKADDFDEALRQAMDYIGELEAKDRPQRLIICNFKVFRLYEVPGTAGKGGKDFRSLEDFGSLATTIPITELPQRIREFAFLLDFAGQMLEEEEKASIEAAQRISNLHNVLSAAGYRGTDLELLLVRVLFCLFADPDSYRGGIFGPKQFSSYIALNTQPNGKDTGDMLELLFEVLNTPPKQRSPNLAPALQAFPYVNGGLFSVAMEIPIALGTAVAAGFRMGLLECGKFDWASISPEIFGSLFQEVLTATERRFTPWGASALTILPRRISCVSSNPCLPLWGSWMNCGRSSRRCGRTKRNWRPSGASCTSCASSTLPIAIGMRAAISSWSPTGNCACSTSKW